MKFAKIVFRIAAIWGFLIVAPLYFIFDLIGKKDPPPITHPAFYYGFVGVALVWQVADRRHSRKARVLHSGDHPGLAKTHASQ
jgi:hypothetical protein